MHSLLGLLVVALVAAVGLAAPADKLDKYTNKYDGVDIDQILASDRLVNNYFNCLMERGPCTPEGTELRGEMKIHQFIRIVLFNLNWIMFGAGRQGEISLSH